MIDDNDRSAALSIRGLTAGYARGGAVLRDVDIDVADGSLTVLVGANGAGKTTLLNALSGLLSPSAGSITLGGTAIAGLAPNRVVGHGLLHVAEGRRVFREQSVAANLRLGLYGLRLDRKAERHRIDEAITIFPDLASRLGLLAGALSGGQQQMLAIAQAMIRHPRVLLLDEPSLGLAPKIVDEVLAVVSTLSARGVTVLLVEQLVERALGIADYGYVMQGGRVVGQGTGSQLLAGDAVRRAYLGAAAELPA